MKDEPTTIICAAEQVAMDGVPEESRSMLRDLLRRMYDNLK